MSERMTDERREELRRYIDRQYLRPHEADEVNAELDRARASEVEKDAQIKALAEAAEDLKAEVRRMATVRSAGFSCDVMDHADAALRLSGRR